MEKSAQAFRTISEVAELLETPAHVLRFWESRFTQVKPVKRAGGRRYYRPADLALLGGIKQLLHEDGLTIRGVQKILKEQGVRFVASLSKVDIRDDSADTAANAPESAVSPPRPAAPPAEAAKPAATIHPWPASPDPEPASGGDTLLPDPEDVAEPTPVTRPHPAAETYPAHPRSAQSPGAEAREALGQRHQTSEAPMEVDAPTLPLGEPDNIRTIGGHATSAPASTRATNTTPPNPPAATLLRAMDTLRARDKRGELMSVYLRLADLRERLARSDAKSQN